MPSSNFRGIALCAVLLLAATAHGAVRRFPPFEQLQSLENPNQRIAPRADEELNYRLPNDTVPIHYDVELSTNVHTGETAFEGTVIIDVKVIETTSQIVVHARQLTIKTVTIQRTDQEPEPATEMLHTYDEEREFLTITTEALSLPAESTWKLRITYEGHLRTDNGGFYLSTFTDDDGSTKYLATTQFESTDARHAFPCFDEPAKRATFKITIHHDPSYNAISNMPAAESTTPGVTSFETTLSMSTYLVAFIVSDFVFTKGELNGLPQRVFSRQGTEDDQEWALTSGMLIEKRLSEYFGVRFAFPKLDQAAIPDFAAGAMENWGLATYREEYLLYNPVKSTVNTQTNIATIEAHEDAHMWFGDLVCIEWWTYLWLKEGFATLFENLAIDQAYPEWDIFQTFHAGSYQSAMVNDASPNARAMTHFVQKPSDISLLYDSVSYAKAGSVLDMWRHALPNNIFKRGLHNYLEANQFSAANETHLFDAIALAAKEDNDPIPATIDVMMGSWIHQGGLPLLIVERNYNDKSFTVKQEQYTNDKSYKGTKYWYVPINYAVKSDPDFRNTTATHYLANVADSTLSITDSDLTDENWLVLNKQSTGYYRIMYDLKNWDLIIEAVNNRTHKIHQRNRAQFISDLYRFSTSGRIEHSVLLRLLTYLPRENMYAPWSATNTVFTIFNRYLSGDDSYGHFKFYVSDLISRQYDKFGVDDVAGEHHLNKYTRQIIINLACMVGVEDCLTDTSNKLQALVNNGIEIEPNVQSQVYCNGLRQSDEKVFNFVYDKLMNSNDQAERRLLISALGCAQDESQINKFVESTIDTTNQLRSQERITLLSSAYSRGEVGLLASINFLEKNWETYAKLNSGFGGVNPLHSDIVGMSAYAVNENQQQKLQNLVNLVKDSEYVYSTLEGSVNTNVAANNEWLKDNRDALINWMTGYRSGGSAALSTSITALATLFLGLLVVKLF